MATGSRAPSRCRSRSSCLRRRRVRGWPGPHPSLRCGSASTRIPPGSACAACARTHAACTRGWHLQLSTGPGTQHRDGEGTRCPIPLHDTCVRAHVCHTWPCSSPGQSHHGTVGTKVAPRQSQARAMPCPSPCHAAGAAALHSSESFCRESKNSSRFGEAGTGEEREPSPAGRATTGPWGRARQGRWCWRGRGMWCWGVEVDGAARGQHGGTECHGDRVSWGWGASGTGHYEGGASWAQGMPGMEHRGDEGHRGQSIVGTGHRGQGTAGMVHSGDGASWGQEDTGTPIARSQRLVSGAVPVERGGRSHVWAVLGLREPPPRWVSLSGHPTSPPDSRGPLHLPPEMCTPSPPRTPGPTVGAAHLPSRSCSGGGCFSPGCRGGAGSGNTRGSPRGRGAGTGALTHSLPGAPPSDEPGALQRGRGGGL